MFEGSQHHDRGYFQPLQGAGATLNGSTNADRTNYWEVVPAGALELALWMESDRMGYLLPALTRGEVRQPARRRAERAAAELREPAVRPRADGAARGAVSARSSRTTGRRSARSPTCRPCSSTKCARSSAATITRRTRRSRSPATSIPSRRSRWSTRVLRRDRQPAQRVDPVRRRRRRSTATRRILLEDRVELPRLYLAWLTPAMFAEGDADLDLATDLLANGKTSRLYRRLVFDERIATDVSAVAELARDDAGFAQMTATARAGPHAGRDRARRSSRRSRALAADGPTDDEIERGRVQAETQFVFRLQTVGGFGGKSDQLNAYNVFVGDPAYFDQRSRSAIRRVHAGRRCRQAVSALSRPGRAASRSASCRAAAPSLAAPIRRRRPCS